MKEIKISFLGFLTLSCNVFSQNLVLNGGFETYFTCPSTYSTSVECPPSSNILYNGICEILPWLVPPTGSGTPDYYNACAVEMGVPDNITGNQAAHSGQAYVGFGAWMDNEEYKEYISSQFSSPMIAGQQYVVSFYISLSEYSQYSINRIGAYISVNPPTGGGIFTGPSQLSGNGLFLSALGFVPQVATAEIIGNYNDWVEVCQIYTASGGENYISIGNFFPSSSFTTSDILLLNPSAAANGAYYYIDDISVTPYAPVMGNTIDTTSCFGQLTLTAINGSAFLWNTGATTQSIDVTSSGQFWVEVSNGCFSYTDTFNVTLNSFSPTLGSDTTICAGTSITIGVAPNLGTYLWSPTGETGNEITVQPATTTNYQLSISGSCGNTLLEKMITVSPNPIVDAGPDRIICEGQEIVLSGQGANQYFWNNNVVDGLPFIPVNSPDTYILTGIDQFNCQNTDTMNLTILNSPHADFLDFTVTPPDYSVKFTNTSSYADFYQWIFDGGDTSTVKDPDYIFQETDANNYKVTLVVYNASGCADSITKLIQIIRTEELIYYVPNTFTPDGNKFNNVFQPVFFSGINPFEYLLRIYDRWGEILFESHNHEVGWDGTYGNELGLVQEGTYVWIIDFTTTNGERKNIKGHITLLK